LTHRVFRRFLNLPRIAAIQVSGFEQLGDQHEVERDWPMPKQT
jgi:hypothetical protein